jgi:ligand-binding sensor domain-containing protein
MRTWSSSFTLLLASLLAVLQPAGIALAQLAPERHWTVFRQSDGLISNAVFDIHVAEDAIWFGTDRGISRFDGRWQSMPVTSDGFGLEGAAPISTPGNVVAMTGAGSDRAIWIGTDRGYLAQWSGQHWSQVMLLESAIHDLAQVAGRLWIATDRGLLILDQGMVTPVPDIGVVPAYDLAVTDAAIWLGAESGLWRLAGDGTGAVNVSVEEAPILAAGPVHAIWSDGDTSLWLGMGPQLLQYFPGRDFANVFQAFENESYEVTAITGIEGESVWITTAGRGVTQFMFANGNQVSARILGGSTEGGLETDEIRSVSIDNDGSIWFATPVGVYRYQAWAWQDIDAQIEGLAVTDLLQDRQGDLWVATKGEGIQRRQSLYQRPTTFFPDQTSLPSEFVNDLEEDAGGNLWAATNAGIARFADEAWSVPVAARDLPSPTALRLQADSLQLWIGTAAGLARYRFEDGRLQDEPLFNGQRINALKLDELGRLWVASQTGSLWHFTEGAGWSNLATRGTGMPADAPVTALLPDPALPGGMYAAFQGAGIFRWNDRQWKRVDMQHWSLGDRVLALGYEPSDGSLWIGSEIGLSRLDALSLTTYDSHDGLQNGAIRAILRNDEGAYWFGGQKGLSYYRPETTPPWLQVGEIKSLGARATETGWLVFAGRPVEVSLAAGDIQSAPDQMRLFYRIGGDHEAARWQETPSNPIVLPMLPEGTYQLEIMVRDKAFNYSPPVVQRLEVLNPPATVSLPLLGEVQTRIFQLLVLFGGLAGIGFGYVSYEIIKHRLVVTAAVRRGYNPYISGEPVRREEMFYGRHDLLERIVSTLHNNSIMIHGERRIGKTTLLYQLAHALRMVQDSEYWFVPVFVDLEGTTEQRLFHVLMEEIAHAVSALPDVEETDTLALAGLLLNEIEETAYTDREFNRDLRVIVRLLEQYSARNRGGKQVRLILLIDEVDTLSTFDHLYQQQLRRIFMRDFAATVGAVVAGIAISKEWDRVESPWFNLFNEVAMEPFTYADAVALIVEPVRGYYVYEPVALDFIIANSGGRPYRIQQYALEAVNHMLQERRRRITLVDVVYAHQQILTMGAQGNVGDPQMMRPAGAPDTFEHAQALS